MAHWMVWWYKSHAVAFTGPVTRRHPKWTPIGDFGETYLTALNTTIIKTPINGISFRRMSFIPPLQVWRCVASMSRCTEVVLAYEANSANIMQLWLCSKDLKTRQFLFQHCFYEWLRLNNSIFKTIQYWTAPWLVHSLKLLVWDLILMLWCRSVLPACVCVSPGFHPSHKNFNCTSSFLFLASSLERKWGQKELRKHVFT